MKKSQWLCELIVLLLALLFLYTAFSKLIDMRHWIRAIHNQVFPKSVDPFLVVLVPIVEIVVGVALLIPKWRRFGFTGSMILLSGFSIYILLGILHAFKRVPCGCAGVFQAMSWPVHLVFNVVFLSLTIIGLILNRKADHIKAVSKRYSTT
ncbi:hypothetical protein DIU31_009420 [Mucilaginibacter rubeus]|uniref:Methylamine utilisation protein MauE domain-containing protein n=1 Tax=Mucilaginibacter rubeus TaxID=2027860 RepID=A0AAE6JEQ1_9SPHI|nr:MULTISPECIES: MauE/DoxX family redox-associated membrane protein [Mucilaginibacter]QEM03720.1 hypothetical protein DIU31_009420 [Mucilaginibacter rubeus]QEM16331.1 hypothetical protein DIU38_009515 [Mucilaginibacter gossypii]QTE40904.1 hypothetical protein J3L19_18250 [Mucilaginibacter rubeus]QTE47507.1 hypothetical protein J3L21_18225 [Mucilaginibacter rubeus]QTE58899.1 hypothetical protein J3L23_09890 [Mucilaginibacter rubeus]